MGRLPFDWTLFDQGCPKFKANCGFYRELLATMGYQEKLCLLLQMLLSASAATVSFSLLPWLLDEIGIPQSIGWRICSGTLFVWFVAIGMRRRRQSQNFTRPASLPALICVWIIVSLALQAINLYLGEAWPFLLGVINQLANGFIFFLLLLFWEGGDGPAHQWQTPGNIKKRSITTIDEALDD